MHCVVRAPRSPCFADVATLTIRHRFHGLSFKAFVGKDQRAMLRTTHGNCQVWDLATLRLSSELQIPGTFRWYPSLAHERVIVLVMCCYTKDVLLVFDSQSGRATMRTESLCKSFNPWLQCQNGADWHPLLSMAAMPGHQQSLQLVRFVQPSCNFSRYQLQTVCILFAVHFREWFAPSWHQVSWMMCIQSQM